MTRTRAQQSAGIMQGYEVNWGLCCDRAPARVLVSLRCVELVEMSKSTDFVAEISPERLQKEGAIPVLSLTLSFS
jgi:hypothetical protein